MDLNNLNSRNISIGSRTGHYIGLRSFLTKTVPLEQLALMTDERCVEKLLELGLVPVEVKSQQDDNETIYLIQKSILEESFKLVR